MELKIRRAAGKDIPILDELLLQVENVHNAIRPDLFAANAKKYDEEQLKRIITDVNRQIFVAETDGTVSGYAFCIYVDHKDSNVLTPIKTLYVDDLCVNKAFRGKGIGKKLYEYVIEFARNNGFYNVTLNVWADNVSAVSFYKKLGMNVQKIGMETIL